MTSLLHCLMTLWLCITSPYLFSSDALLSKENMESKIAPPTYLYKILSYRNWQATENRKTVTLSAEDHDFIHLSTEEQLDKIIEKYWSDVPQFVVLKLSTNKLEGDLRLEANPGGTTKYYHLYQGFIPFSSITESKVIYRSPSEGSNKNILAIVEIGDPVLRKPAKELTKEEILSPEVQHLILEMKEAMRTAPGVGLAAPQIGQSLQIAVIEDLDHTQLTKEQLAERERYKVPYHVIINPRITIEESGMAEFFEGCLSIPDLVGIVSRAKSVRVECLNERAEPVVIQAKGWYARILQHEIDHLNGTLFVDHVKLPSLMTSENYVKFWKDKSIDKTLEELTFKRIEHGSKN